MDECQRRGMGPRRGVAAGRPRRCSTRWAARTEEEPRPRPPFLPLGGSNRGEGTVAGRGRASPSPFCPLGGSSPGCRRRRNGRAPGPALGRLGVVEFDIRLFFSCGARLRLFFGCSSVVGRVFGCSSVVEGSSVRQIAASGMAHDGSGSIRRSAVSPCRLASAAKNAARRCETMRASFHGHPATRQAGRGRMAGRSSTWVKPRLSSIDPSLPAPGAVRLRLRGIIGGCRSR
jgi:hypothetical protein